jgi:hypothetical protein
MKEQREDLIRRLAKNRYDLRMSFKFKLEDTAIDDWHAAERQVERDEKMDRHTK